MNVKGFQVREWVIARLRELPDELFEKWFDEVFVSHTLDEMARAVKKLGEK